MANSTPIPYPLVNGVRHSFASIEFKFFGQIIIGFKSITYSRKRERTKVYGAHPNPLGKTRGKNSYDASCELYLAEFNASLQQLGDGYGDVFGDIFVTYSENGFDTIQDVIRGCTIDTTEAEGSEGTDPLTRKIDLSPLQILFNGIEDLAIPLRGVQT